MNHIHAFLTFHDNFPSRPHSFGSALILGSQCGQGLFGQLEESEDREAKEEAQVAPDVGQERSSVVEHVEGHQVEVLHELHEEAIKNVE